MNPLQASALLFLFLCACTSSVPAVSGERCDLRKLEVGPWKPNDFAHYVGKGTTIEVSWANPSPSKPADQFDQPPLLIRNTATGSHCAIDGGIWMRDQIYVSSDEKTMLAKSYSGSSIYLGFYDTSSCREITNIEVSGPVTVIEKNRVTFDGGCEYEDAAKSAGWCSPAAVYALENGCKVTFLEKESRAQTKKLFGTEFTKFSKIAFPHTSRARVLQTAP